MRWLVKTSRKNRRKIPLLGIVSEISWTYCGMQQDDVVGRDCRGPQENTELSKSVVLNFAAPFWSD